MINLCTVDFLEITMYFDNVYCLKLPNIFHDINVGMNKYQQNQMEI
jgi:hypothetical protein